MAIISFPSQNIYPTKPKTANYRQATASSSTWYTILDVTAGTGILNRIVMTTGTTNVYNYDFEIKITIDGIENTLTAAGYQMFARGLTHRIYGVSDYTYNGDHAFYYETSTYFYKSLKIEIRSVAAVTAILESVADYCIM